MGEVVILDVVSRLDIPVDRVLDSARNAEMTECIVIGFDANGEEFFATSVADGGDVLWHMERAKLNLLRTADK